ncbi:Nonsense-mediated mRNA decay factor SMG8 [Pseudolycoriella hygida]|uniref:Nonsense-mediated mRNA decay factor SMG8 n=1 Tax=Pseudolycoriella hygida TaxID=35572 RepID=A0A9Q0NDG9_9DIPT|nr:Nonsense-mediated mRNA decay factor SMG8 [Pseudolycoriella hygida]
MDIDEKFFTECCEHGLELGLKHYKNMLPHHYSSEFHEQMIFQSCEIISNYGRPPQIDSYLTELRQLCDEIWRNGKQQCELLSLRNNPCIMPKHDSNEDHSSGIVYISTCNCGRTQGRRDDPYTIRQANYDFYQVLAKSCPACSKLDKFDFSVFEPSTNDFRAAELERTSTELKESFDKQSLNDHSPIFTSSQSQPANLSLGSIDNEDQNNTYESDDDSVNEIVIKVGSTPANVDKNMLRQPSTTEYLPGMIHMSSPVGLLPQFPSWSLVCVGPSSVYSHNSGLPEHAQSGFLSQANFLLPWDVHVRVTTSTASWAATYEKTRSRKKPHSPHDLEGQVFVLKIFVGCEYECTRGHRFIMNSPDQVLRGGSTIPRDSGSKIVFNDMPLYFPCPCRSGNPKVAQLLRVHIVTPKAPVDISIDPKVRIADQKKNYIFTPGKNQSPKLTQSSYWILRLPYIYQGDDGPLVPPSEVTASNAMLYGCLLSGMYEISESCTD